MVVEVVMWVIMSGYRNLWTGVSIPISYSVGFEFKTEVCMWLFLNIYKIISLP